MEKNLKLASLLILLLAAVSISACRKPILEKDDPKCLKEKIRDFERSEECSTARVDAYSFQGETVYAFDPGNCGADMMTNILDSDCNTIGGLGGIAGNTEVNGEPFSNAVYLRNVWTR